MYFAAGPKIGSALFGVNLFKDCRKPDTHDSVLSGCTVRAKCNPNKFLPDLCVENRQADPCSLSKPTGSPSELKRYQRQVCAKDTDRLYNGEKILPMLREKSCCGPATSPRKYLSAKPTDSPPALLCPSFAMPCTIRCLRKQAMIFRFSTPVPKGRKKSRARNRFGFTSTRRIVVKKRLRQRHRWPDSWFEISNKYRCMPGSTARTWQLTLIRK